MFTIKKKDKGFSVYELHDTDNNSFISVIPELGGMVSEFRIDGEDVLYFDKELYASEFANMEVGGNPFLFPITGRLTNGSYIANGSEYFMEKHGFAHKMPWQVRDIKEGNEGKIIIELKQNEESLKSYPFKFRVALTYILKGNSLYIYQEYMNEGEEEMPFYSGFHPFFKVRDKKDLRFDIYAEKYVDCTDGYADYYRSRIKEYNGAIDFGLPIDYIFPLKKKEINEFSIQEQGKKLTVEMSEEYEFLVMWTLKGKDFICVEPWMSAPDAFNTGKGIIKLRPGDSKQAWVKITKI